MSRFTTQRVRPRRLLALLLAAPASVVLSAAEVSSTAAGEDGRRDGRSLDGSSGRERDEREERGAREERDERDEDVASEVTTPSSIGNEDELSTVVEDAASAEADERCLGAICARRALALALEDSASADKADDAALRKFAPLCADADDDDCA